MLKKLVGLISDALTYGASSMLGQVLSFLLLPLYTRHLTPEDYGILALLTIVILLFSPLANLGMTSAIFRRFNMTKTDEERREVLSTGLYSVLVSSLLLTILGLTVLSEPLARFLLNDVQLLWLIQIAILTGLFNTIGQVPNVILRADRKVKIAAVLNVITLLINIVLTIIMVVFWNLGVVGAILANLTSSAITMILRFAFVYRMLQIKFIKQIWLNMLNYGLPFLPHRLQALGLAQFGVFIVAEMLSTQEAGIYSIALRLSMPMTFVIGAIQKAWVPYKFQIHAEDDNPALFFRVTVTYYITIITYLWLGVSMWGGEVVRFMTTPGFFGAISLIPLVALIPFANGLYYMLGTGMELSDNTTPMPLVSFSGLVTVVISAFIFVPILGTMGAALATTLGWLTMTAVIYYFSQKRFSVDYEWLTMCFVILMAVAVVILGTMLEGQSWQLRGAYKLLASILFPLCALWVVYQTSTEKERIRQSLSNLSKQLRKRLNLKS